ncbi:PadR family transcriptional regulator [Enterococcus florum]|uniref:PadR family transcriptional regulator n=1 Tax=Enterococcus florum TaxID=2480627 RepID=A0A4P5PIG0_9ENTE|nr:PadR family transcriptional regulator [Enterococcus florum]GCF95442.1 PadR family transcriptional regulator [Enterococcus florum]
MQIIILGLIMTQDLTIYEIRQKIRTYLSNVSSDSTGSIQTALKKLLENGFVTFTESVENGKNRKKYMITRDGENYFKETISTSMLYKEKNMELAKLFFMGYVDKNKRVALIDSYIKELEKELQSLKKVAMTFEPRYSFEKDYLEKFEATLNQRDLADNDIHDIARFQYATLDFSIEKIEFEIRWFINMRNKVLSIENISNGHDKN